MNTDRDNFYDWAKDKPDTTSYARLDRSLASRHASGGVPWGRMAKWVVLTIVVVAALKFYVL